MPLPPEELLSMAERAIARLTAQRASEGGEQSIFSAASKLRLPSGEESILRGPSHGDIYWDAQRKLMDQGLAPDAGQLTEGFTVGDTFLTRDEAAQMQEWVKSLQGSMDVQKVSIKKSRTRAQRDMEFDVERNEWYWPKLGPRG